VRSARLLEATGAKSRRDNLHGALDSVHENGSNRSRIDLNVAFDIFERGLDIVDIGDFTRWYEIGLLTRRADGRLERGGSFLT